MADLCPFCGEATAATAVAEGKSRCPRCGAEIVGHEIAAASRGEEFFNRQPPSSDEPSSLAGCIIQGYRLRKPIGEGPIAFVYEGEQIALRRQVAIKILKRAFVADADRVDNFLEAARISASLIHPNIAQIYNVLSLGDIHFVAREYLDAPPLAACASVRPLPLPELLRLARKLLAALQYAHAAGIIHGDLSPANVFIGAAGEIKIVDFCYSPFVRPGFPHEEHELQRAVYVAPERLLGKEADIAGDIYSLGATLYFAATALPPYAAREVAAIIRAGEARAVPRPHIVNPNLPPEISEWVAWLLSPPQSRPSSIEEAEQRLKQIAGRLTAKSTVIAAAPAAVSASSQTAAENLADDRRRYRRLPAEIAIKVSERATAKDSAVLLFSRAANIGENGIFVRCSAPLAIGSFVDVELALEGRSIVKAVGVVRWTRIGDAEPGMGIQFLQVSTSDRQQLRDFLEERTAAEVARRLTQDSTHRAILKLIVCHWGQKITLEQLGRVTGASRPILLRVLANFEKEKLVRVSSEEVLCVRPDSARLSVLLEKAVLSGRSGIMRGGDYPVA